MQTSLIPRLVEPGNEAIGGFKVEVGRYFNEINRRSDNTPTGGKVMYNVLCSWR